MEENTYIRPVTVQLPGSIAEEELFENKNIYLLPIWGNAILY